MTLAAAVRVYKSYWDPMEVIGTTLLLIPYVGVGAGVGAMYGKPFVGLAIGFIAFFAVNLATLVLVSMLIR
jgi:hypothetical protein